MKHSMGVALVLTGTVLVVTAVIVTGTLLWNRSTARMAHGLLGFDGTTSARRFPFSRDELEGLPAPVVRYFRFALTPGQSSARLARFNQRGEFALHPVEWKAPRSPRSQIGGRPRRSTFISLRRERSFALGPCAIAK